MVGYRGAGAATARAGMNPTSLYVSTCRALLAGAGPELATLLPGLRAALACVTCGGLLRGALLPAHCLHAVCRGCEPSCDCPPAPLAPAPHLRLLVQAYRRACRCCRARTTAPLAALLAEGAAHDDVYEPPPAPPLALSPPPFAHCATQTTPPEPAPAAPMLYSVMYAGTGNKITIKRKQPDDDDTKYTPAEPITVKEPPATNFKKPAYRSRNSSNKRKGCRCGNATATPGKLTCCGQRCPCYVKSKACSDCKCKGCRNPHRADGLKVRPHIPPLESFQISHPIKREYSPSGSNSAESADAESFDINSIDALTFDPEDIKPSDIKVYTSQLREVSADLPAAIMMDEDVSPSSTNTDDGSSSPRPDDAPSANRQMPTHNFFAPFRLPSPRLQSQDGADNIKVEG